MRWDGFQPGDVLIGKREGAYLLVAIDGGQNVWLDLVGASKRVLRSPRSSREASYSVVWRGPSGRVIMPAGEPVWRS